jgi:hypothetical protein
MDKQFEYRGYWWLPNNPDSQIAGILTYIPNDRIELELIGDFYEDTLIGRSEKKEIEENGQKKSYYVQKNDTSEEVIHGVVYDSNNHVKKVTLLHCSQGRIDHNFYCSFSIIKYRPYYVLIGKHLNNYYDSTFSKLKVYTPVMNSWLFPGAILFTIGFDPKDKTKITEICWKIETDKNIIPKYETQIDKEYKLSFYGTAVSDSDDNNLNIDLHQATTFELAKTQGKATLGELFHRMHLFLHFLNLASLDSAPIKEIVLFDDDYGDTYGDKFIVEPISLYYIPWDKSRKKKMRDINCLFTFKQVEGVFDTLIQKWYSDSDIIAPIRNHLVNSIIRKPSFDSGDFLVVVQALEGYHRRFVNDKKQSLKTRLQDMVSEFNYIDRIKLSNNDLDAIVQSRDYYSHFFKREEKPQLLDGKELFLKYVHLRVLLICCTLRLIGLDDNTISELVKKCRNGILDTQCF